jgi:hypothetical protein
MERANTARPLRILVTADSRSLQDKAVVGQNFEGKAGVVRSQAPVPLFVEDALKACFAAWGVKLTQDGEATLYGDIANLFVREENRYNADINIRFRLQDRAGQVLWEGVATGHASTWGRSAVPANYNQVLSDAMRLLSADLLGNPSFQSAWSGQHPVTEAAAISSAELKAKVLDLMKESLGTDVIASYVRTKRLAPALTADEILDWKKAGIADEVIKAALEPQKKD